MQSGTDQDDIRLDRSAVKYDPYEGDFEQQPALNRASTLLTSWLQRFNRKSHDLRNSSQDHGQEQAQNRESERFRNYSSQGSATYLFRPHSLPNQDHVHNTRAEAGDVRIFEPNSPVLNRNSNQNLTQQSESMEAHNPSGRFYRGGELVSYHAGQPVYGRLEGEDLPLAPYLQPQFSEDQYDEVERLRSFFSVSRTYDECVQFLQNLTTIAYLAKQNEPVACLQSEFDEAKSQIFKLSMELEIEKSNSKKIYENFHIAVWGLGGFPDGEIGIELEDFGFSASNQAGDSKVETDGFGGAEGVRVRKVLDWGPAYKTLLKEGDIIEKVSGYDVKGLSANFVQHLIKGPSGTSVTINARHFDPVLDANKHSNDSYTITLPRIRWPQRELTLIEKGLAACECITSMKEEIRLLVGQIDDLECRLDAETSELMDQLQEERTKVFLLENTLLEHSKKGAEHNNIVAEIRKACADELLIKDKRIASLESVLQVRMKELARSLEEQLSAAQLLKIRQSKLADGYEARLVEIQETAQAVRNSIDLSDQTRQKSPQVLSNITNNLVQFRTIASYQFQRLHELSYSIEKQILDVPNAVSNIISRACGYQENFENRFSMIEEALGCLENDVALMRYIADRKAENNSGVLMGCKGLTGFLKPNSDSGGTPCVLEGVPGDALASELSSTHLMVDQKRLDKDWTCESSEGEDEEVVMEEERLVCGDDTDDSSTADALPDGSGLERALPTIHFSCRSSVRDGIDTEFEITSDSSSLCSVSAPLPSEKSAREEGKGKWRTSIRANTRGYSHGVSMHGKQGQDSLSLQQYRRYAEQLEDEVTSLNISIFRLSTVLEEERSLVRESTLKSHLRQVEILSKKQTLMLDHFLAKPSSENTSGDPDFSSSPCKPPKLDTDDERADLQTSKHSLKISLLGQNQDNSMPRECTVSTLNLDSETCSLSGYSEIAQHGVEELPPGWRCRQSRKWGRLFYYHSASGRSQWHPPPVDQEQPSTTMC